MSYPLIDSHCHLESFVQDGTLSAVLERAHVGCVEGMITVGTSSADWSLYQKLAAQYAKKIHYSVGIHPCSVNGDWQSMADQIAAFWKSETVPVAIGETGLDYHWFSANPTESTQRKAWQMASFLAHLDLAARLDCPVIVHSRGSGAFEDCFDLLRKSAVKPWRVIFHCFVESGAAMQKVLDAGMWGSFTGILTYKNASVVREAAKVAGLERMILETDCPWLAPVPFRSKPNEPAYLSYTAHYAAELFGVDYLTLRETVYKTTCRVYGLSD